MPPSGTPTFTNQVLGTGTGSLRHFRLRKSYTSGPVTWWRMIRRPVAGTVRVAVNGVERTSGWIVDLSTGIVSFTTAPSSGQAVTAGFEFDVPVRFDSDEMQVDLDIERKGTIDSITLVELREPDAPFPREVIPMKSLSSNLQAHLSSGATTLAWCWRLTRSDGLVFGFTDHDRPLIFEGTEFEPDSGLTAAEIARDRLSRWMLRRQRASCPPTVSRRRISSMGGGTMPRWRSGV